MWPASAGQLACAPSCDKLDSSGCTIETCGNGKIDGDEKCDGVNVNGQSCASQGFGAGVLLCQDNCSGFVTTACNDGNCCAAKPTSGCQLPFVDGEPDGVDKARAGDDETAPEAAAARKGLFPSSIGLSFLVPAAARSLTVTACWGDYSPHEPAETDAEHRRTSRWRRTPRSATCELQLQDGQHPHPVDGSGGLEFVVSARLTPTPTAASPSRARANRRGPSRPASSSRRRSR